MHSLTGMAFDNAQPVRHCKNITTRQERIGENEMNQDNNRLWAVNASRHVNTGGRVLTTVLPEFLVEAPSLSEARFTVSLVLGTESGLEVRLEEVTADL